MMRQRPIYLSVSLYLCFSLSLAAPLCTRGFVFSSSCLVQVRVCGSVPRPPQEREEEEEKGSLFFFLSLLFFAFNSRDSYNHLMNWLADARSLARADISIIAVGKANNQTNTRQTFRSLPSLLVLPGRPLPFFFFSLPSPSRG